MNFPYFGDAETFLALGERCQRGLELGEVFTHCYNGLRPIGAIAYFTLPRLVANDPVTVLYVQEGLNVAMFLLLLWALLAPVAVTAGRGGSAVVRPNLLHQGLLVFGALALMLPFLPVALSDLPSCALFVAGVALLSRSESLAASVLAGVAMGTACLVKQNYYVFTAFAIGLAALLQGRNMLKRPTLYRLAAVALGASISLLQLAWVWAHTGRFYPFAPADGFVFDEVRKINVIELVAFSLPSHSAYLSMLDGTALSHLSHFCVKLMQGFFAYRPAVYLGAAPLESPVIIHLDARLLVKAYAVTLALVGVHLWAAWISPARWRLVLLLSLAATLFTAWYIHVENRYFVLPKILLLWWLCAWALPVFARRFRDSALRAGLAMSAPRPEAPAALRFTNAAVITYALVLAGCFLLFQQQDLLHTIGSSYAYLNGHWRDFYDYNAGIVGRNDYLPGIYLLFALWELPLKLAGSLTQLTTLGSFGALSPGEMMWGKALGVIAFFGTAAVLGRVGKLVVGSEQPGRMAAAVFATSPVAIFAVFMMGQYDVLAVLLMMTGLLFYFQRRFWWFAAMFSLAIPLKYFPAVYFLPLLLLAPVSWGRRLQLGVVAATATVMQVLAYWNSPTFRGHIFELAALKLGVTKTHDFPASLVLTALGCVAVGVYWALRPPRSDEEWHRASIFAGVAVSALLFTGINWHPQWLLFAVPFFALASLYLRRPAVWYVLEAVAALAFAWILANHWPGNLDASMVQQGVFKGWFPVLYLQNADLLPPRWLPPMHALFTAYLFAPAVLLLFSRRAHPSTLARYEADGWMAARFFFAMAVLLGPYLFAAFASQADAMAWHSQARFASLDVGASVEMSTHPAGEITDGRSVQQAFIADRDGLAAIGVRMATYGHALEGTVQFVLTDSKGARVASHVVPANRLLDNAFYAFDVPPIRTSAGQRYVLSITTQGAPAGHAPTAWLNRDSQLPGGSLSIDGNPQPGTLNIKLMYTK